MTHTYHEYPKWVTPPGGKPLIVNDTHEERQALAGQSSPSNAPTATPRELMERQAEEYGIATDGLSDEALADEVGDAAITELQVIIDDERARMRSVPDPEDKEALIAKAKSLGINANKLWGVAKLKASIAEAEAADAA